MQKFSRDLLASHCLGHDWPTFCGQVALGEPFCVETVEADPNGPIQIIGIRAGDAIAVHVEAITLEPPFFAPNGGPFVAGMGEPVPIALCDGTFRWHNGFVLRAEPSIGNLAVLPEPTDAVRRAIDRYEYAGNAWPNAKGWRRVVREPRAKHCHQDCWAIQPGSTVHLRAQVDGAGLCVDDVHGYISHGELAFAAIECNATVQLRVERSSGWDVDWPLVETPDEILICVGWAAIYVDQPPMRYVDLVREGYRAMRLLVATRMGMTIAQANSIVATAASVHDCALYGLGEGYVPQDRDKPPYDLAIAVGIPRHVFAACGEAA